MEALVPLAVIGLVTGVTLAFRLLQRRRPPATWRALLHDLGQEQPAYAQQLAELGLPRRAPWRVDLLHGETLVRLSVLPATEAMSITAEARFPVPAGPEFKVFGEGLSESVLKEWGMLRDVTLGQREFDLHFVVNARDEEAMRLAFSARAREIMLRRFADAALVSDSATLALTAHRAGWTTEAVAELVELLAGLASADLFGVGALRGLPGAVYHPPTGPFAARTPPAVELEAGGTRERVRLEPAAVHDLVHRPVTRASIRATIPPGRWSVAVRASGELGERPPDQRGPENGLSLPPGLEGRLYGVGAGTLAQQGQQVSFTWTRVETERERLLGAVQLLALFARPVTLGAYR